MSIPKDGYYRADVILDGRGLWPLFVHVRSGAIYDGAENKLLPEACSNFREVNTTLMVRVWPDDAAMELEALRNEVTTLRKDDWVGAACLHLLAEHGVPIGSPELLAAKDRVEAEIDTLRTANAGLVEKVKRLEAAGDEMAAWLRNPRNLGDDPFMADQWEATKGQP